MTSHRPSAPAPRHDPHRLVTRAKIATIIGSAVGFGAVAGLVLANQVGVTLAAAVDASAGPAAAQQPTQAPASDFFSPPPGFAAQPPLSNGFSGSQGGLGSNAASGSQGFSGNQGSSGGFGGQMPGLRTGGS